MCFHFHHWTGREIKSKQIPPTDCSRWGVNGLVMTSGQPSGSKIFAFHKHQQNQQPQTPPFTTKPKLHFRFLLNVTINGARVFKPDGSTRKSNLKIVNLRRNVSSGHGGIAWEEVIIRNIIGSLYNIQYRADHFLCFQSIFSFMITPPCII